MLFLLDLSDIPLENACCLELVGTGANDVSFCLIFQIYSRIHKTNLENACYLELVGTGAGLLRLKGGNRR